jgi:hypothetical protein
VSRLPLLLLSFCAVAFAQDHDAHRALIQRDQQSAEFAARMRGEEASRRLEALHEQQNRELAHPVSPELRPYQRERFSQERSPIFRDGTGQPLPEREKSAPVPDFEPLPLPGGLPRGVDPVVPQGLPY